jgi:hypothetical protein
LTWAPPSSDGGTPITGYVIERRAGIGGVWAPVTKTPVTGTEYTDNTLNDGVDYQYRIVAVNTVGPGEPSAGSRIFTAKDAATGEKSMRQQILSLHLQYPAHRACPNRPKSVLPL